MYCRMLLMSMPILILGFLPNGCATPIVQESVKHTTEIDKDWAVILYDDGTWEHMKMSVAKAASNYDVDVSGEAVKNQCLRLCARKVRYCTEWLSDGKCKLWDWRTEYYCCPP